MWAEEKNNSRTGEKKTRESGDGEREKKKTAEEGWGHAERKKKENIKRREEEEKNTPPSRRDGEGEQESGWFLSLRSWSPLHDRRGRGSAAATLCTGRSSRCGRVWRGGGGASRWPAEVPHVEAGSDSWTQANQGAASAGATHAALLDDTHHCSSSSSCWIPS